MSRQASPQERRAFGRRESCIHAVVHIPGRGPLHCIVRNYSGGGALLELPEPIDTAQPVRLVIESFGVDTTCEVRHRNAKMMGVRFHTAIEIEQLAPRVPAVTPAEPIKGSDLRQKLFGTAQNPENVIVKKYTSYSSSLLGRS